MSALSDRLDQAITAITGQLATLKADLSKAESDLIAKANADAQAQIAQYSANAQSIIQSTKQQCDAQIALARQEFQAEKQAELAAQEAAFNKQLADLKAQIAAPTK